MRFPDGACADLKRLVKTGTSGRSSRVMGDDEE